MINVSTPALSSVHLQQALEAASTRLQPRAGTAAAARRAWAIGAIDIGLFSSCLNCRALLVAMTISSRRHSMALGASPTPPRGAASHLPWLVHAALTRKQLRRRAEPVIVVAVS